LQLGLISPKVVKLGAFSRLKVANLTGHDSGLSEVGPLALHLSHARSFFIYFS
jgi:hypothetical protein